MTVIAPGAVKDRKIKLAFGELVGMVGGLEAAAAFCRVSKSALARYASLDPEYGDRFAPIDVVRDLEALAGQPLVTSALATLADGVFIALPEVPQTNGDLHLMLAALSKEFGEATGAVCTGLADGDLNQAEREHSAEQVLDVIRVATALHAALLSGVSK